VKDEGLTVNLEYKINDNCMVSEVEEVFIRSGIRRPVGDLDRIQRMIDNADEIITVREGSELVGFLRAITDYSYCCYISDIAVDTDYQGLGIGKELIRILKDKLGEDEIQYVLTSAPKAVGFYERVGFERADKAFVIKRKRN
jgi:ribosomal protein S18 acetylase RimI-like enzyme